MHGIIKGRLPGQETQLFLHLKKWLEKVALEWNMIEEGDRILVGVSGGADSLVLLDLLCTSMVFLPPFTLVVVHVDLGFDPTGQGTQSLQAYLEDASLPYVIEKTDIGPLAHSSYNRKNPCFLCSRLRRKRIFEVAAEQGCRKIAFAHHQDDIIETLLLNLFYAREISTMVPNQVFFGGQIRIIRPLAYLRENLIKKYARERKLPVCENLCPTSGTSRRRYIKDLLDRLEKDNRHIRANIFRAMGHVKTDYLLMKETGNDR